MKSRIAWLPGSPVSGFWSCAVFSFFSFITLISEAAETTPA
jgi:hypothetical protein